MQTVAVIIILAVTIIYLASRLLRFFRKAETDGCGSGCHGCTARKSNACGLPDRQAGEDDGQCLIDL